LSAYLRGNWRGILTYVLGCIWRIIKSALDRYIEVWHSFPEYVEFVSNDAIVNIRRYGVL
jgi:hypothetical protein